MPEPPANPEPVVYQLRVVLRGISPLIWRRLLVRSDATIADLHATLQLALGWADEHLNRFLIQGREYGVARIGAMSFRARRSGPCVELSHLLTAMTRLQNRT